MSDLNKRRWSDTSFALACGYLFQIQLLAEKVRICYDAIRWVMISSAKPLRLGLGFKIGPRCTDYVKKSRHKVANKILKSRLESLELLKCKITAQH